MLARIWRAITSRPVLALVCLGAGVVLAGELRGWIDGGSDSGARAARPTRRFERWKEVTIPVTLRVPSPPADDLRDARRRWNRPDLVSPEPAGGPRSHDLPTGPDPRAGGDTPGSGPRSPETPPSDRLIDGQVQRAGAILLAEALDKRPAPAGVEVAAVLETDGRTTLIVRPRRVPFLGAPLRWRLDGWVAPLSSPVGFGGGVTFRALRFGRVELGPGLRGAQIDGAFSGQFVVSASFDF